MKIVGIQNKALLNQYKSALILSAQPRILFLCISYAHISMVDVAQSVEHQVVALGVMGSNPIIHPKNSKNYTKGEFQ